MSDGEKNSSAAAAAPFERKESSGPATPDVKLVLRPFLEGFMGRKGTVSFDEWCAAMDRALDSAHRIHALELALHDALEHVYWMSAASDFHPGGQAHGGWIKVREDARRLEGVLRNASSRTAHAAGIRAEE